MLTTCTKLENQLKDSGHFSLAKKKLLFIRKKSSVTENRTPISRELTVYYVTGGHADHYTITDYYIMAQQIKE